MFVVALVMLIGCRDSDKNSSLIFEELNESLERSNRNIEENISITIMSLEDISNEPASWEKAATLLTKAQMIKSYCTDAIALIDSLKARIMDKTKTNEDAKYLLEEIFIRRNEGANLYGKLNDCRRKILSVDENIRKEFTESLPLCDSTFKKKNSNEMVFTNQFFMQKSTVMALASLVKFKNDVLFSEYETISFLRNNIAVHGLVYDRFNSVVTQNSIHFKYGDELAVSAGVVGFDVALKPEVSVNGVSIDASRGIGIYKTKIDYKPGKYKVPVRIRFKNEKGENQDDFYTIEYTVDK